MNRISSAATKSLTVRYIIALVAIGTTCIASQVLIRSMLVKAEAQAKVVDIAGRQRMLSQRIAKVTERIAADVSNPHLPNLLSELATSSANLKSVHQSLGSGDELTAIPRLESGQARVQLQSIDSKLEAIVGAANSISTLAAADELTSIEAIRLARNVETVENDFLTGMNQVVALVADHSITQINRLFWAERLIMSSILFLLLLEAIFVFRPAVRRARESIQDLCIALSQARGANEKTEHAISERSTALTAAAFELKRLSVEIASLKSDERGADSLPSVDRFDLLVTHVQNTLAKLTDLADRTNQDESLLVSRTSPRNLVQDAVHRFRSQIPADSQVNVTMDARLPASLLIDERVFRDSIIHLLRSVFDSTGPNVSVHVGYDDREYRLSVVIQGEGAIFGAVSRTFLSPIISAPQLHRLEFNSLDLLIAKRGVERLGGTICSGSGSKGIAILMPLDETKQMNLFSDSDRLQIA